MRHVNRNKTKITYIDPGKGHWGMHDGWGTWDKEKYHRILGVLFCKNHWTIPSSRYEEFASCIIHTCTKCNEEAAYKHRKHCLLAERAKGRKARLEEAAQRQKTSSDIIKCLKEIYSNNS